MFETRLIKTQAVIGSGCSAVQVIPSVAEHASVVKQYARSPQWYHERPNRRFSALEKFMFRYIPGLMRLQRWNIFWNIDKQSYSYRGTEAGVKQRLLEEEHARQYIYRKAPEKYHNVLVPDFELGCKRKIADPDYLESLHRSNVELIPEGIQEVTENGVVSLSGRVDEYDMIVLATGFKVSQFLTPMRVVGANGRRSSSSGGNAVARKPIWARLSTTFPTLPYCKSFVTIEQQDWC